MMSENEQRRLVSSFLEITVGETVTTARRFLQATSWNLGEAVLLFYSGNQKDHVEEDEVNAPLMHDPMWEQEQGGDSSRSTGDLLASLYKPPFDLMFNGSLHQAKSAASDEDKWLLVNLQSRKEFASHTLNRDTWGDEVVSETIKNNFVFLQVEHDTTGGQKIHTFYKIETLPAVLLIDPITGQKMRLWYGMVEGEILLEELVPFMDDGPKQQLLRKKQHPTSTTEEQKPSLETEKPLSETATASLETLTLSEKDQANAMPMFPPLPQEPITGDPRVLCRVGFRFPDGRRLMRTFLKTEPIQLLWSFCYAQIQESEMKQPFKLVETRTPGSSNAIDYGSNQTFEQSGLANSIIFLSWG
ncbi:PREDICTED: plant UBX domain-containing protein 7-like [Tarenaya hassleriana]|uniref:plant UBX domain-containing protein 7-like n=1 Tax=Tarenaya hassleriana TaxID=28532 RepID=UPI00053C545A|nr:PREDICTED: plant UBX domain-containing protein 7-like [Tarenaya hassleriana]